VLSLLTSGFGVGSYLFASLDGRILRVAQVAVVLGGVIDRRLDRRRLSLTIGEHNLRACPDTKP
jgi:hypothetical protein